MNTSIILIAYHADKWLPRCIESLEQASVQRMHLVLVDNSGNTVLDNLDYSAFDTEILRTSTPLGFAEANNFALAHASRLEETVTFLNQDTISEKNWVDQCLDCFKKDIKIGALSPLIRTYDNTGWDPSFLDCLSNDKVLALNEKKVLDSPSDYFTVDHAPAPSLVVRTHVLKEIGPFDPVFGSYYEDYDLCLRIRRKGYKIGFSSLARIYHFSGSTTTTRERELKRMRQIIRNRIIFKLRESDKYRPLLMMHYLCVDFPRRVLRGMLRTSSSQPPSVTLKAYSDLLGIGSRLMSRKKDEKTWQAYLDEMGWPARISGLQIVEK